MVAFAVMGLVALPQAALAVSEGDTYTITYKTDDGTFSNGTDTNTVGYTIERQQVTRYSHTDNIDDTGVATGTYAGNLSRTDVVTIPGATTLSVEVWYSTEGTSYDWLAIYPSGVTPTQSNYSKATVSGGKLGGGYGTTKPTSSSYPKTYTVSGDTVQFYFRSDYSGNYYGYYAIVTAEGLAGSVTSGAYEEPTLPAGEEFKGWFSNEAHTTSVNPSTLVADTTVYGHVSRYDHEGTCGTVSWGLTSAGELHFWPTDGVEGTFASNTRNSISFWPWYPYRTSVTSVTSEGTIHGSSRMSYMFSGCTSLSDLSPIASWDTSAVTSMDSMFSGCTSLANADALSNWDTSSISGAGTDYSGFGAMFQAMNKRHAEF